MRKPSLSVRVTPDNRPVGCNYTQRVNFHYKDFLHRTSSPSASRIINVRKTLYPDSPTPRSGAASDPSRFGPPLARSSAAGTPMAGSSPIFYVYLVGSVPCPSLQAESISDGFRSHLLLSDKLVSVSAKSPPSPPSRQSDFWETGPGLVQVKGAPKRGAPPLSRRSLARQGGDFDSCSS